MVAMVKFQDLLDEGYAADEFPDVAQDPPRDAPQKAFNTVLK